MKLSRTPILSLGILFSITFYCVLDSGWMASFSFSSAITVLQYGTCSPHPLDYYTIYVYFPVARPGSRRHLG